MQVNNGFLLAKYGKKLLLAALLKAKYEQILDLTDFTVTAMLNIKMIAVL